MKRKKLAYRIYPKPIGTLYFKEDLSTNEQVINLFDYCQILEAIITKDGWRYLLHNFGIETLYELNSKSGWQDCESIQEFQNYVNQEINKMIGEILLIPDKPDLERDRVADAWEQLEGEVKRIGKFWIKPNIGNKRVSIYGYDTFCLVLAQILEIEMVMPKDEMIRELSQHFLKRKIDIISKNQIEKINFPKFIKPVKPKLFKAQIFHSIDQLTVLINDIDDNEELICSEIIDVNKEVRSFILDREIKDIAFYEGEGNIEEAIKFINQFLNNCKLELPKTFVLDIGFNEKDQWFVIEFNSCWGAGLNFCDPNKVIECIREAAINKEEKAST